MARTDVAFVVGSELTGHRDHVLVLRPEAVVQPETSHSSVTLTSTIASSSPLPLSFSAFGTMNSQLWPSPVFATGIQLAKMSRLLLTSGSG